MTNKKEIYKCNVCGNIVEVLHDGKGTLVCCNQNMVLQKENTMDASIEKHIPIIKKNIVKVGSIEHPMEEKHYIEWIEATGEKGEVSKVFLKPGIKPEAEFCFKPISARAYCNLHGLWKSK
ncbi:MAG: Desulfoferrodoxin 2-Fe-SOR [archaeon GW2011_AR13]|nr:MAG: Desulfoferrodoxin 2-Fe-SOR [archaeon GW2011_AR13]HIG93979.1 desulfoferrodoxin [Nanoarchaeota archaeon]HIH63829.1 desulfoferrodoxin [Nanoarchaeota archaeon]HIJ09106.1 desulfoferrodoxin [Nanoarchaeota archaeon]